MSLKEYKRKRNFQKTAEPAGKTAKASTGHHFVVQKHDASRLHYDFRLEHDGTLKSWAVPKGPNLDPAVKSLAVQVEDHPLDYADFEGIIPEGEYGGGTVMVWDRGTWDPEEDLEAGFRSGKLKFKLHGEKLKGSWTLVRMGGKAGDGGKNWLLIKHRDAAARPKAKSDFLARNARSVLTGRTMEEIAASADRTWKSKPAKNKRAARRPKAATAANRSKASERNGRKIGTADVSKLPDARRAKLPKSFKPQLATLSAEIPDGNDWLHELKFDGYRILAHAGAGKVRLITRNGNDWTHRFPTIAAAVGALGMEPSIVDGEVVSLDENGKSDFQQLQNSLKSGDDSALVYYVFDAPFLFGYDLTATPLVDRKQALAGILSAKNSDNSGALRYSDDIVGSGELVLHETCAADQEGVVSKRTDSPYQQSRSPSWLKTKCHKRQEFVIGGYTRPTGSRVGLGALLLGYYRHGDLVYAGRVGTGFTQESLRELRARLNQRQRESSPFESTPNGSQGVHWVTPDLVGEVEFTDWTDGGLLRHPSFKGIRTDKPAREIVREEAKVTPKRLKTMPTRDDGAGRRNEKAAAKSSLRGKAAGTVVAGVTITHPDRVLFPEARITKLDLAQYYEEVADWILPHVVKRPLTLVRCPEGRAGQCFYQKHWTDSLPDSIHSVMIKEKDESEKYVVIDDLAGLISLVQMGVLEFHPWPARVENLEKPDRLVFDLDPGDGVTWTAVVQGAKDVHVRLAELGLESFLRTSGGKGLHVVTPLAHRNTWNELKEFAKGLADSMVRHKPGHYIATMSKAKRRGKVFIDYLRNQRGATAIASYSSRARAGAPVAAPLAWDELSARLKADKYNVQNMRKRLGIISADPWKGFFATNQSITNKMLKGLQ